MRSSVALAFFANVTNFSMNGRNSLAFATVVMIRPCSMSCARKPAHQRQSGGGVSSKGTACYSVSHWNQVVRLMCGLVVRLFGGRYDLTT